MEDRGTELVRLNSNEPVNTDVYQQIYKTLVNIDKRCEDDRLTLHERQKWKQFVKCLDKIFFCLFLIVFLVNLIVSILITHI